MYIKSFSGKVPKEAKFPILLTAVNSYDKNTSQTCKIYKYNIFFPKKTFIWVHSNTQGGRLLGKIWYPGRVSSSHEHVKTMYEWIFREIHLRTT